MILLRGGQSKTLPQGIRSQLFFITLETPTSPWFVTVPRLLIFPGGFPVWLCSIMYGILYESFPQVIAHPRFSWIPVHHVTWRRRLEGRHSSISCEQGSAHGVRNCTNGCSCPNAWVPQQYESMVLPKQYKRHPVTR
jgi:hypothetical protein